MKNKLILLVATLLISMSSFAQKDQIKAAEKSLKNNDAAGAKKVLLEAESLIGSAEDDLKAQYYFVKGNVLVELAKKNVEPGKNYLEASKSFKTLFDIEKKSGKAKYTKQAEIGQLSVINGLKADAYKDYSNKNYKEAASKYYELYNLNNSQADFLFNASNAALLSQDYDLALTYLEELKSINYSGERIDYIAVSKLSGKEEFFDSKKSRDEALKITHEKPKDEKVPSKRGEIYKNIALILLQKGKVEEAKNAIAEARQANPDDISLILSEADLYLKANDMNTYGKLITEVLEKQPNNAELIFNLGVISYSNKDYKNAEKYYLKVIELNPKYANAYFNLAALKIDESQVLLEQMNKLGTSAAENKKYDALKKQRDALLTGVVGYLEKTISLDDKNNDAKLTLVSVYNALEMTDKAKSLKATIKE